MALYTVAAHSGRRAATWAVAATVVAIGVMVLNGPRWEVIAGVALLAVYVAAWALGDNMRTRRAYLHGLEEKADRLERERSANARRATAEEQARIARELHDVIAHSVSVMVVQAAAAGDIFETNPARAREALGVDRVDGRAALAELRRLLGTMRNGGRRLCAPARACRPRRPRRPRPGRGHRRSTCAWRARPRRLAGGRRPFRVPDRAGGVDEHAQARRPRRAPPSPCGTSGAESSSRSSTTASQRRRGDGTGHGMIGMRERASLYGGEIRAEPRRERRLRRLRDVAARRGADVTIRVLLADDQALVRSGFRMILDERDGDRGRWGGRGRRGGGRARAHGSART